MPCEAPPVAKRERTSEAETKKREQRPAAVAGLTRALRGVASACARMHATVLHRSAQAAPPAAAWRVRSGGAVGSTSSAAIVRPHAGQERVARVTRHVPFISHITRIARTALAKQVPAPWVAVRYKVYLLAGLLFGIGSRHMYRTIVALPPVLGPRPERLATDGHRSAVLAAPARASQHAGG